MLIDPMHLLEAVLLIVHMTCPLTKKKSLQILDTAFEDVNVLGDLVGIIQPEFILILKMNNEYNSLCISAV